MKKIPTLFARDWDGDRSRVIDEQMVDVTGATPTIKVDGTSCMVDDNGKLFKRYDCKKGRKPPEGFIPCAENDGKHWPGWVPVDKDDPQDKWHFEPKTPTEPGTYELIGPKVQGNPYGLEKHQLVMHGSVEPLVFRSVSFGEVRVALRACRFEGVVWWRNGEPIAKIKRRDFGIEWPVKDAIF